MGNDKKILEDKEKRYEFPFTALVIYGCVTNYPQIFKTSIFMLMNYAIQEFEHRRDSLSFHHNTWEGSKVDMIQQLGTETIRRLYASCLGVSAGCYLGPQFELSAGIPEYKGLCIWSRLLQSMAA